jgi:FtsZ-interacting cell division protein ZipA
MPRHIEIERWIAGSAAGCGAVRACETRGVASWNKQNRTKHKDKIELENEKKKERNQASKKEGKTVDEEEQVASKNREHTNERDTSYKKQSKQANKQTIAKIRCSIAPGPSKQKRRAHRQDRQGQTEKEEKDSGQKAANQKPAR